MGYSFSVIIPVYRDYNHLGALLGSLAKQRCKYAYEILVVDDGSPEADLSATKDIVEHCGLPGARLLAQPENMGPAAARNAGVEAADADVLVFIDADCELIRPDHLERLFEAHSQRQDALVGGGIRGYGQGYVAFADSFCHWATNIPTGELKEMVHGHLVTAHLIFSRRTWEKAGPLDTRLRTGEDTAFCFRARKLGIGIWLHGGLVLRHHDRESLMAFCRCFFEVGKDRRDVRLAVYGRAPVYLGPSPWTRLIFSPLVAAALTLKTFAAWWPHDKKVLLALPGIVLASASMSAGVVRGR